MPSIMSEASLSGDWFPVESAPRDGTPVILWMAEDEAPPALPVTVGFWTIHLQAGVGYWQIFGDHPRFCSDRPIHEWKPLLQDH
jgi:hypothetical protein